MIKAGVGKSKNLDSLKAGAEAIQQALKEIGGKPELILLAVSKNFEPQKVLAGITSVASEVPIAGGSPGWGTITHQGIEDEGVVVMALRFEKIKVKVESALGVIEDPQKAGEILGEKLTKNSGPPELLLIFPAIVGGVAADPFLPALKNKLGGKTNIIGGGTGDEMAMKSSLYQFCNDKVLSKSVVGVGFWGNFSISLKAEHGWEPLGFSMKITKGEGNLISEIDGKPAIEIFEKYFKKEETADPKFFSGRGEGFLYPLGVILEGKIIIRQIVGSTPQGELICANFLPKNATVRLMQVQAGKIPEIAKKMGQDIVSQLGNKKPQLAFIFDCVTRRALVVPDHQKEIDAFQTAIGKETPVFGYYSYGEACSKKEEKEWFFHNETFAVAALIE